jgi:hypothetical protein
MPISDSKLAETTPAGCRAKARECYERRVSGSVVFAMLALVAKWQDLADMIEADRKALH